MKKKAYIALIFITALLTSETYPHPSIQHLSGQYANNKGIGLSYIQSLNSTSFFYGYKKYYRSELDNIDISLYCKNGSAYYLSYGCGRASIDDLKTEDFGINRISLYSASILSGDRSVLGAVFLNFGIEKETALYSRFKSDKVGIDYGRIAGAAGLSYSKNIFSVDIAPAILFYFGQEKYVEKITGAAVFSRLSYMDASIEVSHCFFEKYYAGFSAGLTKNRRSEVYLKAFF